MEMVVVGVCIFRAFSQRCLSDNFVLHFVQNIIRKVLCIQLVYYLGGKLQFLADVNVFELLVRVFAYSDCRKFRLLAKLSSGNKLKSYAAPRFLLV